MAKEYTDLNVPENMEGRDALDFFENWLPSFLDMKTKGGRVKLERALSLAPKPGPDQQPCPVIIRFHSFPDEQRPMAAVRRKVGKGKVKGRKFPSIKTCLLQCFGNAKSSTRLNNGYRTSGAECFS